MDLTTFLVSVNKISLIAFLITLIFLGYELFLLKKEREKKAKPKIPEFKEKSVIRQERKPVVFETKKNIISRPNTLLIRILIVFLIVFGLVSIFGFKKFNSKELSQESIRPSPIIQFISSKGIKIFDLDWNELSDYQIELLKPGDKILIGIDKPPDADIDLARIRVNRSKWTKNDITLRFKKKENVFFKEYQISTGESKLEIEGQLHSKSDGWLGD